MQNAKIKLRQWFYILKHDYFTRDRLFFIIIFFLCFIFLVGAISAMTRNYKLERKINEKNRTLSILELEIETAKLENDYYSSAEYQELALKHSTNKVNPGEKLVFLPTFEKQSESENKAPTSEEKSEKSASNLKDWLTFLLGI